MNESSTDNTIKNILIVFLLVLIFYLMKVLGAILIPLLLALLSAIFFQPFISFLRRIRTPQWLILPLITIFSLFIFFIFYQIIGEMYIQILDEKDFLIQQFELKLRPAIEWLSSFMGINLIEDYSIKSFLFSLDKDLISNTAGGLVNAVGSFTGSFIMFILYYIVFLAGMSKYKRYLNYVSGENDSSDLLINYEQVQRAIFNYIMMKTIVSIITGFLVFLICYIFGVNFALFWGFLAFALNYIPSIGSIAATIPPVAMAFIQFDSLKTVILVLLFISLLQFTIGSVLEPKIMGNRLRLNTLTVIFGLVFWGFMWGVPGMIISIPILVLLKLIFEQIPSLKIIARIMGSPPKQLI